LISKSYLIGSRVTFMI